ncbi:hypothetical protein ABG067_006892 [Albugo candida]
MASTAAGRSSVSAARTSEVERIIATADVAADYPGKAVKYRGRRSTWPGALGLLLFFAGSIAGLTYFGIQKRNQVRYGTASDAAILDMYGSGTRIPDGRMPQPDPDVVVLNPAEYQDLTCEQPNYITKKNRIVAQFKSGREVIMNIKGVNWLGMQDNKYVPKGLWDGKKDGNTLTRYAIFLSENGFNAVRLALSVDAALRNVVPDETLINTKSNRALKTSRYIPLLSSIIQGLGVYHIAVVLNFQVLSALVKESGLWEGSSIKLADTQKAISNLANELCNSKHYNIIGIDLKDNVAMATWGDKSESDWAQAATTLGNHVIRECPRWLVFVQGIEGPSRRNSFVAEDGSEKIVRLKYFTGSDLSGVATAPIVLKKKGKLVYSPKYFTSSYQLLDFFFSGGTPKGGLLMDYVESTNATLKKNVDLSMEYMFGSALASDSAVVLSSFGGLVGSLDRTELKTSTRIIEILISKMQNRTGGLAGGFWWQLNPDAVYPYRAPDLANGTKAGLLLESWKVANMPVLRELEKMAAVPNVNFVPCV